MIFFFHRLEGLVPGAVLAGGMFAVSRLTWQWSMVAEVFTLNNVFVGLLFFLTASFHCAENDTQRSRVSHDITQHRGVFIFIFLVLLL